jgi:hypothetical protein
VNRVSVGLILIPYEANPFESNKSQWILSGKQSTYKQQSFWLRLVSFSLICVIL